MIEIFWHKEIEIFVETHMKLGELILAAMVLCELLRETRTLKFTAVRV